MRGCHCRSCPKATGGPYFARALFEARSIDHSGVLTRWASLILRPAMALSVGTVRDWEQKRSVPDQPAQTLLRAIDREPETVMRVMEDA